MLAILLAGCASVSLLEPGGPKDVPPEFRQRVGLYVHEKAEQFYSHGTGELDTADLAADHMAFHLEQVFPVNAQGILQEVFEEVRMKEPGEEMAFSGGPLAGYFEIKIERVRYDYPDTDRPRYRAEVQLLAEFKTMGHEPIWSHVFWGEGSGFEDANIRLNRFARDASAALDAAFSDGLYQIQEGILESPTLRNYFRSRGAPDTTQAGPSPPPASGPPSP